MRGPQAGAADAPPLPKKQASAAEVVLPFRGAGE